MTILFLAHRAPYPPDRGDKIRSYHVLRYLAARARVHLVAFAEDDRDLAPPPELREVLTSWTIVPRRKPRWRAGVEALASGRPMSLTAFADPELAQAVAALAARETIVATYAFSGQMAQYLPATGRRVMDFVDRDSVKFAAYADAAGGPKRWMLQREARLLGGYEAAVAGAVDATLFVSAAEAALLPGARVTAVENGIDTVRYDPASTYPAVDAGQPLIVFTGQMDYAPNVDAVCGFVRDVLPRIPDATFAIVGRAPTPAVVALAGERVIVTGEVADTRPWLAAADVVVAPLAIARGIQNKVLEAMAMARPVVASTAAAEGIDHSGTIRVAADADAFADQVTELLDDRAAATALGAAARARAIRRYGWDARLAPLDALLGLPPVPTRSAA